MRNTVSLLLALSLASGVLLNGGCKKDETDNSAMVALLAAAAAYNPFRTRSSYPGADDCKGCHSTQFNKWALSGHGYKMNKIENGTLPIYPFTDMTKMFTPAVTISHVSGTTYQPSLSNTAYIIGGFGWKGRYVDTDGYVRRGDKAQYNFYSPFLGTPVYPTSGIVSGDEEFVAYNNTGTADKKAYNCGFCHTTGWYQANDPGYSGTPTLPNMVGNFKYAAITCQRCHGTLASESNTNGAAGHNPKITANQYAPNAISGISGSLADGENLQAVTTSFGALTTAANNVCADCHVRTTSVNNTAATYFNPPFSGYLLQHHEQSQELYVGRHQNASGSGSTTGCVTCHDPHASTKYDKTALGEGVKSTVISSGNCTTSCHSSKTVKAPYTAHACVDCHMPYIVKSAQSFTAGAGTIGGKTVPGPVTALFIPGGKRGDIRTHIMSLTKSANATFMGSTSGAIDGSAAQVKTPVDFSCGTCHGTGGTKGPTTAAEANTLLTSTTVH